MTDQTPPDALTGRWRTGRHNHRVMYHQQGPEPSRTDPMIGVMDTPELARAAVDAHNAGLTVPDPLDGLAGLAARENTDSRTEHPLSYKMLADLYERAGIQDPNKFDLDHVDLQALFDEIDWQRTERNKVRRATADADAVAAKAKALMERRTATLKTRAERAEATLAEVGRLRYDEVDGARFPHDHALGDGPACAGCWAEAIDEAIGEAPVPAERVETAAEDPRESVAEYIGRTAREAATIPPPCPTCSGPIRETTGMVCPTCGTDYAPGGHLQGLQVAHDAPGDDEWLTLDRVADVLRQWARDLHSGTVTTWPHGEPRAIDGIAIAAEWVHARARYEAEVREQQAAELKRSLDAVRYNIAKIGQAWRDAIEAARADIETSKDTEPAEPSLRDVMAAAYQAGLRLRCEVDDPKTDDGKGEPWRHREYAIAPLGREGSEVGRLILQTGSDWTNAWISGSDDEPCVRLNKPTPRKALDAARAAGLIGDTDA